MSLQQLSENLMFGGRVLRFRHTSETVKTPMEFSVFLPQLSADEKVKVIYYLSGLTCNDTNFTTKAGAQRQAALSKVAIIAPDTSPRNPDSDLLPGEKDSWDFGAGAGFYVNATQDPWARNYHMYSYITTELVNLVEATLPILPGPENRSIMGHSMGGHGALVCFLKNPGFYKSVSAFAPICNPINCPWGQKAFKGYLGDNEEGWKEWDASELAKKYSGPKATILVSQGSKDDFLGKGQLLPESLIKSAEANDAINVDYRLDEGYDHSYYYISTFIDDHIKFHASQ